jgi:hypothetical protein
MDGNCVLRILLRHAAVSVYKLLRTEDCVYGSSLSWPVTSIRMRCSLFQIGLADDADNGQARDELSDDQATDDKYGQSILEVGIGIAAAVYK